MYKTHRLNLKEFIFIENNGKYNKKNILISSAGRRVELIQIWKKEAKRYLGNDCLIFANDMNPNLSAA